MNSKKEKISGLIASLKEKYKISTSIKINLSLISQISISLITNKEEEDINAYAHLPIVNSIFELLILLLGEKPLEDSEISNFEYLMVYLKSKYLFTNISILIR